MLCSYFEAFSTFLQWVVMLDGKYSETLHYLDDFVFIGPGDSQICLGLLQKFFDMCRFFGILLALEKTNFSL